jgi:LmbE family N-acetylglucosaminyl deacetylase
MQPLLMGRPGAGLRVLAIGCHCDDIEIGCGGTILKLIDEGAVSEIRWIVLSGDGARRDEARRSAEAMLAGAPAAEVILHDFPDGFFPYDGQRVKDFFEARKIEFSPDVVFTHQRNDLHQDHRLCSELTWNTFRDHLILEYEVPKWDADLGRPGLYVPLEEEVAEQKLDLLLRHFPSQSGKHWYDTDTFRGLMRLRGLECAAPSRYAEAFNAPKLVMAP